MILRSIIREFEKVSGLKVNLRKSAVVGINFLPDRLIRVVVLMDCRFGSLPMKYLGLPLSGDLEMKGMFYFWFSQFCLIFLFTTFSCLEFSLDLIRFRSR